MLCGGPAIHLFSATELERLVCGNPLLDFDAMQANARYDGGYSPEHRVSALPFTDACVMLVSSVPCPKDKRVYCLSLLRASWQAFKADLGAECADYCQHACTPHKVLSLSLA